jgi:hypothetical protein
MNVNKRFVLIAAVCLMGGAWCLWWPASVSAQHHGYGSGDGYDSRNGYDSGSGYESSPITYQNNPTIKCLPFVKVSRKIPQAPRNLIRHQQHQGCIACHKSSSPVAGRGDRPKAMAATALVVNNFDTPMTYAARGGNGQWQTIRLKPGQAWRHTMNYVNKDQRKNRKSMPVFVRYGVQGGQVHDEELRLVATPQKEFGNVYYFKKSRGDLKLISSPAKLYRPKKKKRH